MKEFQVYSWPWLLLRHNINISLVFCERLRELGGGVMIYIFPIFFLNGFSCNVMAPGEHGSLPTNQDCSYFRSSRLPLLGPFQLMSHFQPFLLAPGSDGDIGRWAIRSGGHLALVSEATRSPGENEISRTLEPSLRRMKGLLERKVFLLEPPQTYLWSFKPLTFPFYLQLSFFVFPKSSYFITDQTIFKSHSLLMRIAKVYLCLPKAESIR